MMRTFRALNVRQFALVWSGQAISQIGDRVFQIALAWWVLEKTGSAVAMGSVFIFSTLPLLLFLLIGGVLVDRLPRLWLMLLSDLVRAGVMIIISILAYRDTLTIWHIYLLIMVSGFAEAFFQPAYRALVPEITPETDLTSANSLTSLSSQAAGIIGPAIGAWIVTLGGTPLAFTLDAASFLIANLFLIPIMHLATTPNPGADKSQGILGDLREGLNTVLGTPWLWVTIGIAGVSNIAYAGPMEVGLPFLLGKARGAGVELLGLFYTAASVGSLLAAFGLGNLPRLRHRGLILYGAWIIIGLMVISIGLPIPDLEILGASLIIGACNTILGLVWVNTLQQTVPHNLLGRVSSVDFLGSYILLPIGYGIGGWSVGVLGAPLVFILGGALQTGLITLGLMHPKIRSFD
jgi:MFS family permease